MQLKPKGKVLNDTWFSISKLSGASGDVEVLLYGEIGAWGVTALDFRAELYSALAVGASRVIVHINSVGGDMFDSVAIFNMLRSLEVPVVTYVDSLAASGASLVAMAGSPVIMAEGSFMMIHNPQAFMGGDQHDMAGASGVISLWAESCAKIYSAKTGLGIDIIQEMMDEETWMDADTAMQLGFCDKKDSALRVAACLGLEKFDRVPVELLGSSLVLPHESQEQSVEESEVVETISDTEVLEAVTQAVAADETAKAAKVEADVKAAMMANLAEITALCKIACKPQLAVEFFSQGKSPSEVRDELLAAAVSNVAEVVVDIPAKKGVENRRTNELDTTAIYNHWNGVNVRR